MEPPPPFARMRAGSGGRLRTGLLALAGATLVAGLVLAGWGSGPEGTAVRANDLGRGPRSALGGGALPSPPAASSQPGRVIPGPGDGAPPAPSAGLVGPSPTAVQSPSPAATPSASAAAAPGTASATATRAVALAAPATPIPDLPAFDAIDVLARARDAMLPSGHTFRACVEIGGEGAWPTPVHLYYLGGRRWRVESHAGDAALVFDESAMSFSVAALPHRTGC